MLETQSINIADNTYYYFLLSFGRKAEMAYVSKRVSENERPKGFVAEMKPLMPQQLAPADVYAVPL